jgi:putative transposase
VVGKPVVKIDRWYPSSKTCSDCGWVLAELLLSVRVWTCPDCGAVHDRDLNAALNIRAEGLKMLAAGHADSRNARGAVVRPATGRHAV